MKTKTILSTSLGHLALPTLLSAAAAGALAACSGKFRIECPEGSVQVSGGSVEEACVKAGAGGAGGEAGSAGASGVGGIGGAGGAPPVGQCQAGQKQCSAEGLSECGPDGQWGAPAACEIGCDGAKNDCVVPVQLAAGGNHACARLSDGTVRCWGQGTEGQLGNGSTSDSAIPVPVVGLTGATSIEAEDRLTCATLSQDGAVTCWGSSQFVSGMTAVRPTLTAIEGLRDVKQLAVSGKFLCALKNNGSLECMGSNEHGQLGNGGKADSPTFGPTAGFPSPPQGVSASIGTACASLADGKVACWGGFLDGSNGAPDGGSLPEPTIVSNVAGIREVIVGGGGSCAIRADGNVICWGDNSAGQLGRGSAGYGILAPSPIPGFGGVERLSFGAYSACAIKTDKTLWCWGLYPVTGRSCDELDCVEGPLGPCAASPVGVPLDNAVEVSAGLSFACALTADAKVHCWGSNSLGQLGNGTLSSGGNDKPSPPAPVRWK
jgi:hypothetical protein